MKSVIELSKLADVSKQAVFQFVKSNDIETVKVKNTSYIVNDSDIDKIMNHFTSSNESVNESLIHKSMLKDILEKDKAIDNSSIKFVNRGNSINSNGSNDNIQKEYQELLSKIDKLESINELLNNQIDDLKTDKDNLVRLLDQQQVLSLDSNKKIKRLETEIESLKADDNNTTDDIAVKESNGSNYNENKSNTHRSLFGKLFNR